MQEFCPSHQSDRHYSGNHGMAGIGQGYLKTKAAMSMSAQITRRQPQADPNPRRVQEIVTEGADTYLANYSMTVTQCMPVVHDGRSLGAHVDTTARRRGTTLTKRIEAAIPGCRRIGRLPIGLTATQHLLTAKAMPGALFGCECTSVNVDAARKLRTNVSAALWGPRYSNSSPEIALQGSAKHTLDPELRILDMRLAAMRRAIHKNTRRGAHH